ncbi:MAG: hypothetical protein IKR13_01125 [Victivallales bacterium]|nr:hypothetical protein [Victivallales bacterium]MBR4518662.1 hypothetical protein [Victivallales bacterium]
MKKDNTTLESRKTNKTALVVSFVVIGCLLLAWLVKPSLMKNYPVSGTATSDLEAATEQINAMLQEHTSEYQRRNRQLLEEFQKRVQDVGKENFDQARKNISPFLDKVTSFRFCTKLCYRLVADWLQKTDTAGELLVPPLGTYIYAPCSQGQEKIQDALDDFLLKLRESDTQYRAGLVELANSDQFQACDWAGPKNFIADIQKLAVNLQECAFDTTMVAIGTGLEVVFIRSTLRAISAAMAPIVAKAGTSVAIGVGGSAADGPLPIGDIICGTLAAGGLAWTAYDLYNLTQVLPKQLPKEVAQTIDRAEYDMRTDALNYAAKVVKQCESNSSKLIGKLIQH